MFKCKFCWWQRSSWDDAKLPSTTANPSIHHHHHLFHRHHFQIFKEKKEACHNKGAFDIFASMGHILWDICDMLCCRLFWVGAPLALLRMSVTTGREEHPNLLAFASSRLHVSLLPFYHLEVGEVWVWATSHEQKTFCQKKKIISLVLVNLCCLQSDVRRYTLS